MPHSTYTKIYDTLAYLEKVGAKELRELSEEIHNANIESFAIWRRADGTTRPVKSFCSPQSIRRLLRFMNEIELVDIEKERVCKIRPEGINALKGENFPTQLGAQLIKYMRETVKLPFSSLESIIKQIKRPQIPDNDTIFDIAKKQKALISEESFRRLLYLLQRCDKLSASVKKIYSA